jgi:formate dehydrogenase accessory protein FdhE
VRVERGYPTQLEARRARAVGIGSSDTARAPLALVAALLAEQSHRLERSSTAALAGLLVDGAETRRAEQRYPVLDLALAAAAIADEIPSVVASLRMVPTVPGPLADAGDALVDLAPRARTELVAAWVDDIGLVDPRLAVWVQAAAAPALELAASSVDEVRGDDWHGAACPYCGGHPQVSVISERPDDLLGGSPRSLVCGRCASWWSFPRVTCPACGEGDPERIANHIVEGVRWVRIDACDTCRGYVKTFDLREPGAGRVIPLVDDVASLALDLWATSRGWSRTVRSLAGV